MTAEAQTAPGQRWRVLLGTTVGLGVAGVVLADPNRASNPISLVFCPTIALAIATVVIAPKSRRALALLVGIIATVGSCRGFAMDFVVFSTRSMQAEAKTNLKSLLEAQRAFKERTGRFSMSVGELAPHVEGNRYAYFLTPAEWIPPDKRFEPNKQWGAIKLPTGMLPGVHGDCPACEVVLVAVGNLDTDLFLDVWSISSAERRAPDGVLVPPGVPLHDQEDAVFAHQGDEGRGPM